jgi:DNA gyrase subunit A
VLLFFITSVVLVVGVPSPLGIYAVCCKNTPPGLVFVFSGCVYGVRVAARRLHLVEGLLIAIDDIDEVVAIIRSSADTPTARQGLMDRLGLSTEQADYVLELRLRRLTALAYDELVEEKAELQSTIAELKKILGSEARRRTIVINELGEVVERHQRPRRTRIVSGAELPSIEDLDTGPGTDEQPDTPCVVSLTVSGLVAWEPLGTAKSYSPSRHDVLDSIVTTSLRQPVLAVTSGGKLLPATAGDLPEVGGRSRGKPAAEVFGADRGDSIVTILAATGPQVLLVTASGMAKRLERDVLTELKPGRSVINLAARDRVVAAVEVDPADELVMIASDAQALRTPVEAISVQGAAAKGVAGMSLRGTARVVGAGIQPATAGSTVAAVTVTDRGTAKVTATSDLPVKGRGTGGVRLTKFSGERRVDYAWIGSVDRVMCIVGQSGTATKPDNTPQPLTLRPTRRDGASTATPARILGVGSPRW